MITLRHDDHYNTAFKLHYLLPIMHKRDLNRAAERLGVYIPKSYTKDKMGGSLADFILSNPKAVLSVMNGKELTLIKELIAAGANACIVRPMQKRYNSLQNLGLVVTYEDEPGKQWKMMMPDEVQKCFAPLIDKFTNKASSLELQELTLRISLDNLPIYRTLRVLDTTSLHELYCVITFLFDWCYIKKHAFCFLRNGETFRLSRLTRLLDIQMQPGEKMGFIYDYGVKNWEHTIELLTADNYTGDPSHYTPACIEASYGDPGEEAGGNREVKDNWNEYEKNEVPSLSLLNDSIKFFWDNKK